MYMMASKIFYHQDRIQAFVKNELVKPISVKMRLTDRCNLSCYYCSYKGKLTSQSVDTEDAVQIFIALKKLGVKSIVFTGGEPTFHPKFKEIINIAKNLYGFDCALITNGVIYPDCLEDLTWIRFSLDTVDKETYKTEKHSDTLEDVKNNINKVILHRNSNALGLTVGVQAIVNKSNMDYMFSKIRDVIKFSKDVGADYFQIRPLENYKYSELELQIIDGNIKDLKTHDFGINILFTDYKWREIKNGYHKEYEGCPASDFFGLVDVKGDFYMCCAMTNDKTARYGNLIKENAEDILRRRKEVQKKFNYDKCTLACQGSLLNKTLYDFKNAKHINFI